MSIAALPSNLISLGAPAAERDIERGLEHYFVESDAFRRVLSGETTVVLGNRGAGKSAIFQMLARRSRAKGARVIELAPDDYSYEMLRRTMHSEEDGEHHHHRDMGTLWALTSYLKRLEGFKVGSYEAQLKVKELERLYKLDEIRHLIPHLQAALKDQRVIIVIDELDKGWDSSEDAQAFITGLFQACVSLNRLSPHLRAYISLRQELYDNTPSLYEDAQKYRDLIETICWTEADLQSLIARRLRYSVPRLAEASDARCWRTLFAAVMDGEPGGSFRYIVDRTLHRPREMILFSAQCLHTAALRGNPLPMDQATIIAAELEYSRGRTHDVAAEQRFQYPDLISVFEAFRGMPDTMDRDELEFVALEVLAGDLVVGPRARRWLADHDEEALIEVLWRVSFLEAEVTRRPCGDVGSAYVAYHQCTNLNIRNVCRFRIHPMFRAYLGTRSGEDGE